MICDLFVRELDVKKNWLQNNEGERKIKYKQESHKSQYQKMFGSKTEGQYHSGL